MRKIAAMLATLAGAALWGGQADASPIPTHVCQSQGQALFVSDDPPWFGGDAIYYGRFDKGAPKRIAFLGYPQEGDWIARKGDALPARYETADFAVELGPRLARIVMKDGTVIPCRAYIASAYADESAVDGLALGSVLRAGPGKGHAKVGALAMGADVAVYEFTDSEFDGYKWLKVAYGEKPDGSLREAFVWGGMVCTPNGRQEGAVFPRPDEARGGR